VVALGDDYRESSESGAGVPRDLKRRAPTVPVLAVGQGNLSFGAPPRATWRETKEQRCWKYKLGDEPPANVLHNLPKRVQA
jgi:hypothetical protein